MNNHFGSSISGNSSSAYANKEGEKNFKEIKFEPNQFNSMPSLEQLSKSNETTKFTGLGQDHTQYGNLAGVKIEQKINDNWSIQAQYTRSVQPFDNGQHVRNGQVGFQYRFG